MSIHKEASFEQEICDHLAAHGWWYAQGDAARYDAARALLPDDVLAWVRDAYPAVWSALERTHGSGAGEALKHLRERIGLAAEALDQHRKNAIARDERVTMTGMYNVVEKLRSGEALTKKECEIHEIAACGVLRDLHDELDRLVAEAYGWPWPMEREEILERLVALHDERVEEEKRGHVRWLRPDYQIPRFGRPDDQAPEEPELALPGAEPEAPATPAADRAPWPASAVEQIAALQALVSTQPATPKEAASVFPGARTDLVRRHLDTLALVGEVRCRDDGRYEGVTEPV